MMSRRERPAADLQVGDHFTYATIAGRVTRVEHGRWVGVYLHETGDARWLIAADALVGVRRMA